MRLAKLDDGHALKQRAILLLIRLVSGRPPPDVVKMLMYRPSWFGDTYNLWLQQIMRGPSRWTVGERELFAAFTSRLNQCVF